jgi:biopolymer transport protein TolQ
MSPSENHNDILDLVLAAGPMAQLVLVILAVFSIVSWAIMVERYRAISRGESESAGFMERFQSSQGMGELIDQAESLSHSPAAAIFRAGIRQITLLSGSSTPGKQEGAPPVASRVKNPIAILERALMRASNEEQARLERLLPFLATTAAACPFIGLFGTVWGIMNSFQAIGGMGSANLAVVAPGISEALVATAAGLGAAIPAVVGYNYFVNRIRAIGTRLDNFVSDFLIRAELTHYS